MSINPNIFNPNFWDTIPYEDKTEELLTISNSMNWGSEQLAKKMGISDDELEEIITLEKKDEVLVTESLKRFTPILAQQLEEHKLNIARKKREKTKEENRKYAYQIRVVKQKAKQKHLNLPDLLNVNERTFQNWSQGRSKPHRLEAKVMDILIRDFDTGVKLVIEIEETANQIQDPPHDKINA